MDNNKKIIGKNALNAMGIKIDENTGNMDNFPEFKPPEIGNLYDIHFPQFAFWCQKIQPLVYDDSLSYYEVLCKISYKLNEVIEQMNNLTDAQKEFVEKVTEIINNLINDWNEMIDFWNKMMIKWEQMQNEFNEWKELIKQWQNQWNRWQEEFNQWRIEFNNKIEEINNLLEELRRFKQEITNEWNNYKNELNQKFEDFKTEVNNTINQKLEEFKQLIENLRTEINNKFDDVYNKINKVQGDITNVTVNVQSVPIVKATRLNFGGSNSLDIKDLIYPQVTIRFFSMIVTKGFNSTTSGHNGGVTIFNLQTQNITVDDLNYPWLGKSLTNPAISAGSLSIGNSAFPCTITLPSKFTNDTSLPVIIPYGYGYNGGENVSGTYYVYQGGQTLLYNTTAGYYESITRNRGVATIPAT